MLVPEPAQSNRPAVLGRGNPRLAGHKAGRVSSLDRRGSAGVKGTLLRRMKGIMGMKGMVLRSRLGGDAADFYFGPAEVYEQA